MKVIYGTGSHNQFRSKAKVVAVGVFDGVHLGHQMILRRVVKEARRLSIASAVVTFSYHPSHLFDPLKKIPHLTSLEHKISFIAACGIDYCYVIHFDKAFACTTPEFFVKGILLKKIGMVSLYVGEDFIFGKGAKGDKDLLEVLSNRLHFKLRVLKHLKIGNKIVSSTLIRTLVRNGRLDQAAHFLGRYVSILGVVHKGSGLGAALGYPTANIESYHEVLAPDGIYATYSILRGKAFKSVTYVGTRPTFKAALLRRGVESFLFDFRKNIYGSRMEIQFVKKIRDDKKFPSARELARAIEQDVLSARKILTKSH
jgi:riboflavin kinase/FMN adenylyltransferase